MKKKLIVIIIVLFVSKASLAQNGGGVLTLRQSIETGIENNLQVLQAGLLVQRDEINWKQAKLNRLPDLNGLVNHGINQGRSIDPFTNSYINQQISFAAYGLSSGVVLFNGFSLQHTVKQNALSYEASKMDWQQAKDNLTINIILAYLQVLSIEDVLAQSVIQAGLSKQQAERLEVLNREGAIWPSLYTDLKGQYANDQLSIINSQNALATAKLSLSELMNVPYDKNIKLERLEVRNYADLYEATPDNIYQTALQQFSLIKAVDLRKQSAQKALRAAQGRLFPTLSLNGNVNTNYSNAARADVFLNTTDVTSNDYVIINGNQSPVIRKQNNFKSDKISYGPQLNNNLFNSISLNLRIPIFNSFQTRNNIKLSKINLQNTEIVANTTKTQLQQSIEQAYINLTTSFDRYKVLLEQVAAFSESFRAAEIRFNAGVGNSIDYLTAKNNLDRANVNLVNAKYEYLLRTKVLDYYQGKQLW